MKPTQRPIALAPLLLALAAAVLGGGCVDQPALNINRYALEYAVPSRKCGRLPVVIKVRRFESAAELRDGALLWRQDRYARLKAVYSHWVAPPSDLVTDLITRDLAASGCYKAVLRYDDDDPGAFEIAGALVELYGRPGRAVIALRVSLVRPLETDTTRRIVFQRTYRQVEKLAQDGPSHLAAALSRAMARVSARVREDVYRAVNR